MNETNDKHVREVGKRLSWLLRHGANESKLAMTSAGFARVDDVLRIARIERALLDRVIEENNKSRYEISEDGASIRACQGHSLEGTPVTLAGLESSWSEIASDDVIFHGTHVSAARIILVEGMKPMERTHVHLAESEDAKVGKRANVDVLLAVSPPKVRAAGLALFRSRNGVILARSIPQSAIVDVSASSKAGAAALSSLRALLEPSA